MAKIISLTPFCADVGRSLALRGKKLLQHDDLPALVPTLPPLTLYFTIKELGLEEAGPLWLSASAEQRQAMVDLECWQGDAFSADELDAWLAAAAAGGPSALARAFWTLDEQLQVLYLQQSLRIVDHRALGNEHADQGDLEAEALAEAPEGAANVQTPDGQFTLVDLTEDRELPPLALLDALFSEPDGPRDIYRQLTAARTELPSPLAEEALQFRSARMEELGFCSPEEGARLFARPLAQPESKQLPAPAATTPAASMPTLAPTPTKSILPAAMAQVLRDNAPLFCRALDELAHPQQVAALENEWMALVNAAIVGYGLRPSDLRAVSSMAACVRDALSLGLESVSAERPERPLGEWITSVTLRWLFTRAMAAIRPLSEQARAARRDPTVAAWLAVTPAPEAGSPDGLARAFFEGLCAARPLWRGQKADAPHAFSFWSSRQDVEQSQSALQAMVARLNG